MYTRVQDRSRWAGSSKYSGFSVKGVRLVRVPELAQLEEPSNIQNNFNIFVSRPGFAGQSCLLVFACLHADLRAL